MTFDLLIISRQKAKWVDYFYTSHQTKDQRNGQEKRLNIETANNFEAALY